MPIYTDPITMTSYEEIIENLDAIIEKFKKDTIVVIRDANLTKEQQASVAKALGDKTGWFPNNSHDFNQRYEESHSRINKKEDAGPDGVVVSWHVEHVDFDAHTPIVAGIWNMLHFTANPEAGKTYFADGAVIYKNMPEEWQEFLPRCVITWSEDDGSGPFYVPAVGKHWMTGEPVIRIDIHDHNSRPEFLHTVDGREPTDEERAMLVEIRSHYIDQVINNEDIRIVHKWKQGDLVITDLFKHAHAVTGGFSSEERNFTGEWVYPTNPNTEEYLDFITNVVSKRADG